MVQNQYTFDPEAYLRDNPAVANPVVWQSTPWAHYQEAKSKGENFAATFREPTASDPTNWIAQTYLKDSKDPESAVQYYQDPNTGNIYNVSTNDEGYDYKNAKLIASGEAITDPYISALNLGSTSPDKAQELYDLKSKNPSQFYDRVATDLADAYANGSKVNWQGMGDSFPAQQNLQAQLESLKDIDPKAYYKGKISLLSQLSGWDYGQNTPERSAARIEEIKSLIPAAQAAGINANELKSLTTDTINKASQENQQRIANEKASGNFYTQSLLGALKVGGLALGAYGLDTALAAAASNAAQGGLNSYMASAGLNPGTFEGAAFTLPSAGSAGVAGELAGPTYQELGYTGLEAGQMGPTYGELGYTGLNNKEAIALADAASKSGVSFKDAYSTYSRTKQLANILNSATGMGSSRGGFSPQALASALQPQQEQFGGLYRMNQTPFIGAKSDTTQTEPTSNKINFLAQLAEEGKPQPTLADLLRTA